MPRASAGWSSRGAEATWRFVELAARNLLSLSVDCRQSDDPTGEVLDELKRHDLPGAVLATGDSFDACERSPAE